MSTAINNTYASPAANYNAAAKTAQSVKAEGKENGVTTTIMDLKTSTPGVTRKESIKTGFSNINDYSVYLQEKYSYMNTGTTSMRGVPVTVNVSGAFLRKCMDDPEKAAYLEENLAAIPGCIERSVNFTKSMPGNPVMTYCNISIDANGNITMMSGCTNDPAGKIARENAAKKAKQAQEAQRDAQEAAAKKRAEQKKAEEKAKEKRMEEPALPTRTFLLQGRNVRDITGEMLHRLLAGDMAQSFDILA